MITTKSYSCFLIDGNQLDELAIPREYVYNNKPGTFFRELSEMLLVLIKRSLVHLKIVCLEYQQVGFLKL